MLVLCFTDPPNCGCGVLTVGRITTLLNRNRNDFGFRTVFPQEQSIFPNIQFTEHGKVVRWVMGGSNIILSRTSFPELQIWRPMGGNTYKKLNGTTVSTLVQLTTGVYELAVANPLPFQPGDILGLFQPPLLRSILSIHYDSSNHAENYYLPLSEITMEPTHTFIDVNMGDWKIGHVLPLVSVEIGKFIVFIAGINIYNDHIFLHSTGHNIIKNYNFICTKHSHNAYSSSTNNNTHPE